MKTPVALELSETGMSELVDAVMRRIRQQIRTLPEQPVDLSEKISRELLDELHEPLPEQTIPFEKLLDTIFNDAAPMSLNAASPGFMGYVPGGGLLHAAVADLISDSLNRYIGAAHVAPALSQIEATVVRWFMQIVGYPETARGFLTSGGSLANLSALITARQNRLGDDFSNGVIYLSDQGHHCLEKAARLAGFPRKNVRVITTGADFRLPAQALKEVIECDKRLGLKPFFIAASAGTTNTGAVDPLVDLALIAEEEGLWFHVDGAYGGFFCLTTRGKAMLSGIERADSIVLDPHKTLFLPYGTGALLVRDGNALKTTHSIEADYMPPMQEDSESNEPLVDFCELSPELTRPFRGLRIWLPFKLHGVDVFRQYLDEKLDLARWIESRIADLPQLELLAHPSLSILAFAMKDEGQPLAERNLQTRELLQRINEQQRVHLTGTTLHAIFAIRIAVVSFRTHQDRMQMLLEDLHGALTRL